MRCFLIGLMVVVAAVFSASAFAAGSSPSNYVYNSSGPKTQQDLGTSQPSAPRTTSNNAGVSGAQAASASPDSQLPFTGLDLTFFVGAGLVLVAMGVSLRRITRKPPQS
jgi:hypothetical protein